MSSIDEDLIRETIGHYSEGMRTADVETLRKAFHQQAILCGYLGDDMIAAPIQGLYDWVESTGAPTAYECAILGIECTNRVAAATVRETDMHGDAIDYFHLLKVGERWWIVSKVWDSPPADE